MRQRLSYTGAPKTPAQCARMLEALAEGCVRAMLAEIELDPEAYPCCAGCAEFVGADSRLCPSQCDTLEQIAAAKGKSLQALIEETDGLEPTAIPKDPLGGLCVRGPAELCAQGSATTLEAACFQAAQRRRRGADPGCRVVIVAAFGPQGPIPGVRAAVLNSQQHEDPARRGILDDIVTHQSACSCAGGQG